MYQIICNMSIIISYPIYFISLLLGFSLLGATRSGAMIRSSYDRWNRGSLEGLYRFELKMTPVKQTYTYKIQ